VAAARSNRPAGAEVTPPYVGHFNEKAIHKYVPRLRFASKLGVQEASPPRKAPDPDGWPCAGHQARPGAQSPLGKHGRYSGTEDAWIADAHVSGVDYFNVDDWNCFEWGTRMANFALLGVGGFVAPRHLAAIRETGNTLIAACDPHDSVGMMDNYFPDARFFTEIERFDRFLEKRRREGTANAVNYVSICSPNYLHDAHVRLALRVNAHAICEKPLVINPWNLDQLQALEQEYDTGIRTVLQLRYLPALAALKKQIEQNPPSTKRDVVLSYITRRGRWYHNSWKGSEEKSGGLAMNIGIHLFDMMLWIFGGVSNLEIHAREPERVSGVMELEHANVRWFLSIDESDLPEQVQAEGGHAYRSVVMDDEEIEFSTGFRDLHTTVYRETIAGRGHGIDDARPSVELSYRVRTQPIVRPHDSVHPSFHP